MKQLICKLASAASFLALFTGCSIDDEIQVKTDGPVSCSLTVSAAKDGDISLRSLSLDGKTLNAVWAAGEEISVYSISGEGVYELESIDPVGTLTALGSGVTTTLKGSFIDSYTPLAGNRLRLRFLSPDYDNQKGTLDYIASNCDYAVPTLPSAT